MVQADEPLLVRSTVCLVWDREPGGLGLGPEGDAQVPGLAGPVRRARLGRPPRPAECRARRPPAWVPAWVPRCRLRRAQHSSGRALQLAFAAGVATEPP